MEWKHSIQKQFTDDHEHDSRVDHILLNCKNNFMHKNRDCQGIILLTINRGCSFSCALYFAITSDGTSCTCLANFSKTRHTFSHDKHHGACTCSSFRSTISHTWAPSNESRNMVMYAFYQSWWNQQWSMKAEITKRKTSFVSSITISSKVFPTTILTRPSFCI